MKVERKNCVIKISYFDNKFEIPVKSITGIKITENIILLQISEPYFSFDLKFEAENTNEAKHIWYTLIGCTR